MNGMYEHLLADLGEMKEVGGGRILLPESFYPMQLAIDEHGVSKVREDGKGGTPFVSLLATVADGPFKDAETKGRVSLTPGGSGKFIGFINHTTKAITKKPVNLDVLAEYGFSFENGASQEEVQAAFRDQFFNLDIDSRLDFMVKYVRLAEWANKMVIVKYGHEKSDMVDEATGTKTVRVFGRYQGFYALDDKDKGLPFVKRICFPKQQQAFEMMGAAE